MAEGPLMPREELARRVCWVGSDAPVISEPLSNRGKWCRGDFEPLSTGWESVAAARRGSGSAEGSIDQAVIFRRERVSRTS